MNARISLAQRIYETLRAEILSDALVAGERLPAERELAASFDTNRNTLREAIRMLEADDLVSVRQGQGVTVRDFRRGGTLRILAPYLVHAANDEERARVLEDLLRARAQVMETAMVRAAERATDADLDLLEGRVRIFLAQVEARDREQIWQAELAWIDALVGAGHSLGMRWSANAVLNVYRELTASFPNLWVFQSNFSTYLNQVTAALRDRNTADAVGLTRRFYQESDTHLMVTLRQIVAAARLNPTEPHPHGDDPT
jgi:GntR family transcriptional repressor for pyruvate dehydrogenase complex